MSDETKSDGTMSEGMVEEKAECSSETAEPCEPVVRVSCRIDAQTQKDFTKPVRTGSLITMLLGVLLLGTYITLFVLDGSVIEVGEILLIAILIWGALFFGMGLVFLLTVRKNIKRAAELNATNEYSFYEGYMTVSTVRRGENIGTVKLYYSDFVKKRERKREFLLYPNASSIYLIPKGELGAGEIEFLRRVLHLPARK